jgi:Trk K+ transport system NAD-binding subunit
MGMGWIKRVFVAGAGTMGPSIAMVFAQGGYEVDLINLIIFKRIRYFKVDKFLYFI